MQNKMQFSIIGLGNPGKEYEHTRHNVGFHAIDSLVQLFYSTLTYQKSCNALVSKVFLSTIDTTAIIAKPLTYMNVSGMSVRCLLEWYEIPPRNCIIITDNIDLPLGKIRVKTYGGGSTHNGIRSLKHHLRNIKDGLMFTIVHIGVGSHRNHQNLAQYVLGRWHESEDSVYNTMFLSISQSIHTFLASPMDANITIQDALSRHLNTHNAP